MAQYYDEKTKTWYCKFRYTDWQGKARSTTKRGFKTKREAKAAEQKIKDEAQAEPGMTINELAEIYLADFKKRRRPSTYQTRVIYIKYHILPQVGDVRLKDVTPNTIRHWQNELAGLATSTVRLVNVCFSAMLNWAVKFYGLRQNPFKIVGCTGTPVQRMEFWELEEFNKAQEFMRPDVRLVARILFYSGMRVGELLALGIDDVDFDKKTIHIDKTLSNSNRRIGPPKTPSSVRTINLPSKLLDELREALRPLNGRFPKRLFGMSYETIRYQLRDAAEKAGVPVISPHGLRHSHVSYLIHRGVNIVSISKRIGHKSSAITLSVYSHFYKNDDADIAAMLNDAL